MTSLGDAQSSAGSRKQQRKQHRKLKNDVCSQWLSAGSCAFGDNCKFKHFLPPAEPSEADLKKASAEAAARELKALAEKDWEMPDGFAERVQAAHARGVAWRGGTALNFLLWKHAQKEESEKNPYIRAWLALPDIPRLLGDPRFKSVRNHSNVSATCKTLNFKLTTRDC